MFNLATYDLRQEMNVTGGDYPADVSEPDVAKLAMAPSRFVKPPRVARVSDRARMHLFADGQPHQQRRQSA